MRPAYSTPQVPFFGWRRGAVSVCRVLLSSSSLWRGRRRQREREREKSHRRERHSARYYKRFAVRNKLVIVDAHYLDLLYFLFLFLFWFLGRVWDLLHDLLALSSWTTQTHFPPPVSRPLSTSNQTKSSMKGAAARHTYGSLVSAGCSENHNQLCTLRSLSLSLCLSHSYCCNC
jgi:hypothetical protein